MPRALDNFRERFCAQPYHGEISVGRRRSALERDGPCVRLRPARWLDREPRIIDIDDPDRARPGGIFQPLPAVRHARPPRPEADSYLAFQIASLAGRTVSAKRQGGAQPRWQ